MKGSFFVAFSHFANQYGVKIANPSCVFTPMRRVLPFIPPKARYKANRRFPILHPPVKEGKDVCRNCFFPAQTVRTERWRAMEGIS